jgi:DNA-binding beta-propeller fold protein YncE
MLHRPALLFAILSLASLPLTAQGPSPGTGTIFMGSYSGHLTAVDEATGKVTKIPLKTGAPFVVRLSPDKTRFYVQSANQEHFEVVDVRGRQSLDSFTLGDARRRVRALAYDVDPQHRTMVLVARTATRLIDRWEIGAPEFIQYDLAEHKIVRTVPWSADWEPAYYSVAMRFSPDGRLLYVFGHEVVVYDAATMQQVDTWNLSLPIESGLGRLDPGAWDESADQPGFLTSLFTMRDPVQKRNLLVVGQINLVAKSVESFPLGPAPPAENLSFSVAPDRRRAYVLHEEIGRHELWTIDMATRRVLSRVSVPSRPRMQIRSSSSGQILYFYEAGRLIELYSADASKRLRTITLDSDMMYGTFVILPAPAAAPR